MKLLLQFDSRVQHLFQLSSFLGSSCSLLRKKLTHIFKLSLFVEDNHNKNVKIVNKLLMIVVRLTDFDGLIPLTPNQKKSVPDRDVRHMVVMVIFVADILWVPR